MHGDPHPFILCAFSTQCLQPNSQDYYNTVVLIPTLFIVMYEPLSNKGHLAYIVSLLICYSSIHCNLRTGNCPSYLPYLHHIVLRAMYVRYSQARQIDPLWRALLATGLIIETLHFTHVPIVYVQKYYVSLTCISLNGSYFSFIL